MRKNSARLPDPENRAFNAVPVRALRASAAERKLIYIPRYESPPSVGGRRPTVGGDVVHLLYSARASVDRVTPGRVHQKGGTMAGPFFEARQQRVIARRAA